MQPVFKSFMITDKVSKVVFSAEVSSAAVKHLLIDYCRLLTVYKLTNMGQF